MIHPTTVFEAAFYDELLEANRYYWLDVARELQSNRRMRALEFACYWLNTTFPKEWGNPEVFHATLRS